MTKKNKSQARKRQIRRREKRNQKRQQRLKSRAVRAEKAPEPQPQASGHLMQNFWEKFGFDQVLLRLGQEKFKGLPLATLILVLMLFGMVNAVSDQDLTNKVKADPLLMEMCGVAALDKQQLYRLRKRLSSDEYDEFLEQLLREMQNDPRTASRSDGVVSGDDTVFFKSGKRMPDITVVYKSSEKRFGWGYVMPSTHYADGDKDYPLFGRIHKRSEEQKQAAADKRERKRQKLDGRRPDDVKAWLSQLVEEGRPPEVVVLRGPRLNQGLRRHCEELGLAWVGVSAGNRVYTRQGDDKQQRAKALLRTKVRESQWQILNDEGARLFYLGAAQAPSIGKVNLLLVEKMADGERLLYAMSGELSQEEQLSLVQAALADEQAEPENSKLHDMVALLRKSKPFIQAQTATFDAWFYAPWFIRAVLDVGFKRVVLPAKADRLYTAQGQTKTWQEWESDIENATRISVLGREMQVRRLRVQDADLGRVQLLFVQDIDVRKRKGQVVETIGKTYCLLCTDPNWACDKVVQAYKLRWKIEEFYREVRQNHGLTRFHGRNADAIHGHIVFAFISYICVALARLWHPPFKEKTLGWIKHHFFEAIVIIQHAVDSILVGFSPDWIDQYELPGFA
ncbi:MAG: transposase [Caldilineaceae bacterium]|nr:transposase [Caldilineaceae bacterium]MCB9137567.1 transposase [Caldilineaceae bacterium]